MPNHVTNILTITANNATAMQDFLTFVKGDEADDYFDFKKIVPMPEELDITSGSQTDRGIEVYLTLVNPSILYVAYDRPKMDAAHFAKLNKMLNSEKMFTYYNCALSKETIEEFAKEGTLDSLFETGTKACLNMQLFGATTWYNWCIKNWGTKWDAYDQDLNLNSDVNATISFSTAWSAPHPVIEKISEKYPDLSIEHKWADEDIGNNCGYRTYSNGEITEEVYYDYATDGKEAERFACELWGYDPDEIEDEE